MYQIHVIAMLGVLGFVTLAQADDEVEKAQKENQSEISKNEKPTKQAVKKNKSLKEFEPSEEISIDKPVAFPVDI